MNIKKIPMLPLRGYLVFPHSMLNLDVGRVKSVDAVNAAMQDEIGRAHV